MLKMWHPRRGPFLVPGALSEKFGRGKPIIEALGLAVSDKKLSHINLCKTCGPQGGPIFGLRGMI